MSKQPYKRDNFEPDFSQFLDVIQGKKPQRPVLFEFGLNNRVIGRLSGQSEDSTSKLDSLQRLIKAFKNGGYDFAAISGWRTNTLSFPKDDFNQKKSRSLNAGNMITDRASFEKYSWPDAEKGNYEIYQDLQKYLPSGMKLIASGNGGLLENVVDLAGFENISIMTMLDEELTTDIFDAVGSRLLRFYEIVASIETVGACIVNDDWGFKNQTMFSPQTLRRWVFPWHKKIVEAIHKEGKIAILHSCGQLKDVMTDVIVDMQFDAKHSFEDQITPVEKAFEQWGEEIAILGGIDVDFLARSTPQKILQRSIDMQKRGLEKGRYALGSGNSIPDYVPDENYFAMISAVNYT